MTGTVTKKPGFQTGTFKIFETRTETGNFFLKKKIEIETY